MNQKREPVFQHAELGPVRVHQRSMDAVGQEWPVFSVARLPPAMRNPMRFTEAMVEKLEAERHDLRVFQVAIRGGRCRVRAALLLEPPITLFVDASLTIGEAKFVVDEILEEVLL